MSKKKPHKILGIILLLFATYQLYKLLSSIGETVFEKSGKLDFGFFIGYFIGISVMLLFCYLALEMLLVTRDKIIVGETFQKLASVSSVKQSTPCRIKSNGGDMHVKDGQYIKKLPRFKINMWINYNVEGTDYTNIKLRFTVDIVEFEKFKDIKEVSILVNKEDHKDISIDWEWLGRDRIDLYS